MQKRSPLSAQNIFSTEFAASKTLTGNAPLWITNVAQLPSRKVYQHFETEFSRPPSRTLSEKTIAVTAIG